MPLSINDVLAWLETSDDFCKAVHSIDSGNKIRYLKDSFSALLKDVSQKWEKLDPGKLAKIQTVLININNKIILYENYFMAQVEYYELDHYEVEVPHPYDVFPPEGLDENVLSRINEESRERDERIIAFIKENKQSILSVQHDCLSVIQNWKSVLQPYLVMVNQRIQGGTLLAEDDSSTTDAQIPRNTCLKPVESHTLYSGLPVLLQKLKDLDLITADTELVDLRRLFGFGRLEKKIKWKGAAALRHFILDLENQKKIHSFPNRQKYSVLGQLFELNGKPGYDFNKLRNNNGVYAQINDLRAAVRNL